MDKACLLEKSKLKKADNINKKALIKINIHLCIVLIPSMDISHLFDLFPMKKNKKPASAESILNQNLFPINIIAKAINIIIQ